MCLKSLERYTGVSGIARRSYTLLYLSAERLISHQDNVRETAADALFSRQRHSSQQMRYLIPTGVLGTITQGGESSLQEDSRGPFELTGYSSTVASFLDSNLDFGFPIDLDDTFWTSHLESKEPNTLASQFEV